MGDPTSEIMKGIYNLLDGELSYGGSSYNYYTAVPRGKSDVDCARFESLECIQDRTSDDREWDCTLGIQVISHSYSDFTYALVNSLSDQISTLITEGQLTMTGYVNPKSNIQTSISLFTEEDESKTIVRKLIFFNLYIEEA